MKLFTAYAPLGRREIDSSQGIIRGVSVITEGEARGHGKYADAKTLQQVMAVAQTHKDGVKVKANHGKNVISIIGSLSNFRVEGKQLLADLSLLKSDDDYSKIMEMASKMPSEFGLSISFNGDDETIDRVKYARCTELYSVDLVDDPAANPSGLFAANPQKPMIDQKFIAKSLGLPETATEQEVATAFATRLQKSDDPPKPPTPPTPPALDATAIQKAVDLALAPVMQKLTTMETQAQASEASILKAKRDALVKQASDEGKVIPLSDDDVAKLPVETLASMISKLPRTVNLAGAKAVKILSADKRTELRKSLDGAASRGAAAMNDFFSQQPAFRNGTN